ncbi:hypothetical protein GCM10022267_89410 [Lentzea roselyniae]|uniref:[acyl-carrier-protein] S-malonyltransferase n=1 Tax=Lentzea roselyniae TaxID=531940 RepID=A0ABP7CH79_9PSEU
MQPTAFVFPGQRAHRSELIGELMSGWDCAAAHFEQIEQVVRDEGLPSLLAAVRRAAPEEDPTPELLQFELYGAAVAMWEVLRAEGVEPLVLLGHGIGEIAALRCGGAFSTAGGARVVAARNRARAAGRLRAADLVAEIAAVRRTELDTPVYSPVERRFYRNGQPLAEPLAPHLVQPVDLRDAVGALTRHGVRTFVECGSPGGLVGDRAPATVLAVRHHPGGLRAEMGRIVAAVHALPACA